MYFIGFNVPTNGSMEDPVEDYILNNELNNDRDEWEEDGWGFHDTVSFKMFNEEIFSDVDEDGIQTNIKSDNENIKKFVELSLEYGSVFFDEKFGQIQRDDFIKLTNDTSNFSLSICQCSPDGME